MRKYPTSPRLRSTTLLLAVSMAIGSLGHAADTVQIQTGGSSITLRKNGSITIKGKHITIDASGTVNVRASGDIKIKGSKISQN